jgi:murein DD-endopeptidase MepM/ murein hydrolase activator NlpD
VLIVSKSKLMLRVFSICLIIFLCVHLVPSVSAQSGEVEKLKDEISERNNRLKEIEQEIAGYQTDLKKVGGEKTSLQKAINQLEIERKKVQADIRYTQNKISATDLEIDKLSIEIGETEMHIAENQNAVRESLKLLNEMDDVSLLEILLQYGNFSEFWTQVDTLDTLRVVIRNTINSLISEKKLLSSKYESQQEKRDELVILQTQYTDQNQVLVGNKTEKSKLLSATKNQESEYQKLLKERESAREQILKELRDFESKLQFILDPNTVPAKGTQVFNWPVQNVIITQLFGGTEFAKQNASVYGGRAYHPGVDFGVPRGTKILAPLGGVVRATGDTDLVAGCYSWGKWTLIDHANGLSTLYAHQSVISVSAGQQVTTGEIIGYSGNTGYSTGPHLHFTVYAKSGVSVRRFNEIKAVTSCGAATTPVAATDAYIDPMVYLPPAP